MLSEHPKNVRKRDRRLVARRERMNVKRCRLCTSPVGNGLRHGERAYEYCRHCLSRHPADVNRDKCRRYYAQHAERVRAQKLEYLAKNRDKINQKRRQRRMAARKAALAKVV